MRWLKWAGIVAAVVLVAASFMPWVFIASRNITVTGVDSSGTNFGKPAYFHFIAVSCYLVFVFVSKLWSARGNLVVTALNMAWAVRNYFVISMCRGGDCPEKKMAIFVVVAASLVMLIAALFPDIKLSSKTPKA
ncbi:MAG: hypothetical protein JNK14_03660 [Chitinophagaceae bacterium]|nr:hypothetical protein [Chitinophagaceae bacterium]